MIDKLFPIEIFWIEENERVTFEFNELKARLSVKGVNILLSLL